MNLARSLRDTNTVFKICVLVNINHTTNPTHDSLKELYDDVILVEDIQMAGLPNHSPMRELNHPAPWLTKVFLWALTQHSRILFLKHDAFVPGNLDQVLAYRPDIPFAAVPELANSDRFNSGVMLLNPHKGTFNALKQLGLGKDEVYGGDQDLLNDYFCKRLAIEGEEMEEGEEETAARRGWFPLEMGVNPELR